MEVDRLFEERGRIWEAMKAIADAADSEGRELTSEERESWDRANTDLEARDARIKEVVDAAERARAADEARTRYEAIARPAVPPAPTPGPGDELRAFLRGERREIEFDLAPVARERHIANDGRVEHRVLTVGTAGAGGDLRPTDFVRQLYEHLVEMSAIRNTNATVITTDGGENLEVPRTTSHGTAAIVGEGTAIGGTDPSFAKTTLGAWKYGHLVQLSRELLEDSGVDIEGYVARTVGRAIGLASGAHYVTGTGTNQPLGVITACGTGVTGGTGVAGVATADNLIDLYFSVIEPYRRNSFWLLKDATLGEIRKLKGSDNNYLWQPGLQAGIPDSLLGRPVVTDPAVGAMGTSVKSIAFGDFSGYWIRDVRAVGFQSSADFAFDKDLVTFKATLRSDGKLVDLTGAVKAFSGGAS